MPKLPAIKRGRHNVVNQTGVGGTGRNDRRCAAQAAQIDGKGAGMMERWRGWGPKGRAVHIHCRIANRPERHHAIRVQGRRRMR